MAKSNHFLLLLWKNYLLQRRKVTVTILEIGIPTLFAIILIFIRQRVSSDKIPSPTRWTEFTLDLPDDIIRSQHNSPWKLSTVYYSPNTTLARDIMAATQKRLPRITSMIGFPDEKMAENEFLQRKTDDVLTVVVFTRLSSSDRELVEYKLRFPSNLRSGKNSVNPFADDKHWSTALMFPLFQKVGPRQVNNSYGGPPGYRAEGFLSIQYAVDMAIVDVISQSNKSLKVDLRLQRMSYPPYLDDNFVLVVQQQLPMIIVLSFIFFSMQIVKDLVYEKEQKLKESMKLMGLSGWLHWLAWFIKYLLFMLISISIETILFCVNCGAHGSVVGYSSPSVIFVFLLLYGVATISFCFAVSTFFSKANSSAAIGSLIFFVTYIPYLFLQPHYDTLSWPVKISSCLLSNVAMAFGAQVIGMFEGTGAGVQWNTLNHAASVDDNFTMMHVIVMLLVDAVIYAIITWYVEAVFPGDFGIPQAWYFPIQKSYWCGMNQVHEEEEPFALETDPLLRGSRYQGLLRSQFFESEPSGLRAGIEIKNLRKEFKSESGANVAVADMTLKLYESQIMALLGHNGAGKTTTMSILTGFFPPTSGTALINGYDILKDIGSVRKSLGFCPQHNILFDSLTVEEHLIFFTKLKGFPEELVLSEVEKILADIDLVEKRHKLVSTLSGGMKRKLSVGIALAGGSKVVILDEPSSGLDPNARRHLWDLLLRNRAGRTILLSTHFMDEADALGNRIAIMANGVVQCCGTPLFLKKKYGAGYHLVFVKQPGCDVQEITGVVEKFVPDAHMKSNIGLELSFVLPFESKANFERLFASLADQKEWLQFSSYGVSVTTMEEVFLRAGKNAETDTMPSQFAPNLTNAGATGNAPYSSNSTCSSNHTTNLWELEDIPKTEGFRLLRQQFQAMLMKHILHFVRNKLLTICQLLIPLAFTIIALVVIKTMPEGDNQPLLKFDMSRFASPIVAFGIGHGGSPKDIDLANAFADTLKSVSSISLVNVSQLPEYENVSNAVDQYIIDSGTRNLAKYNRHFLIALDLFTNTSSVDVTRAIAYFSNQPYHASAMALNTIDNAIYQQALTNSNAKIVTTNHPMPERAIDTLKNRISMSLDGFGIALNVVYGMSFLVSSFVLFLIRERSSKAKHSQFISGVGVVVFWTSTLVWDLINYMIPCVGILIALAAFGMDQYVGNGRWADIFLLFLLYGWAVLPLMYLLSFIFKVPSTGFIWLTILNVISGVATIMAVAILSIPQLGTEDVAHALEWVFLVLLPNYCLGQGLEDFYSNYEYIKICEPIKQICSIMPTFACCSGCKSNCLAYNENYLGMAPSGIGRMLVFLGCQGCCYFATVLLLESSVLKRIFYFLRALSKKGLAHTPLYGEYVAPQSQDDDDVVDERKRIHETPVSFLTASQAIVLKDLTKCYGRFVAVDRISTAIGKGECFGLLGINGAGKTSTFQMLTGDTFISGGTAYVLGHDLKKDFSKIQYEVGYCPQFDALIEQLTGRETLEMYANIRGLDKHKAIASINFLTEALLLTPYMNKLVKSYSGGTKRKLSTAVALIGGPRIIFLDEPSSGMDPAARRHLWDMLARVRDAGRTLVLTSHSMEECEALCTKIAIMVNGQFRCFGSTQHLKSKFGRGYSLMIKVKNVDNSAIQKVQDFVETTFPGSVLKDVHQGLVHFHLTDPSLKLGRVFGSAESMLAMFDIEDYSISQTTLEQVFINFAQSQVEPSDGVQQEDIDRIPCASLRRCVCCCTFSQRRASIPSSPNVDC